MRASDAAFRSFRLTILLAVAALSVVVPAGGGQEAVAVIRRTGTIPKDFKTYSLFLVCNPQWLEPEKREGLAALYRQFQNFGAAIGSDNAAVWFLKSETIPNDAALGENTDVERSSRFCGSWKLLPSEGPHLVVISTYPDESHLSEGLPAHNAVYKLGKMDPHEISNLLAELTDDLVVKGSIGDSPQTPAPPALWVRLLEATQRTINGFGCAWSFKIDAGPVSANLQACQTH